MEATAAWSLRLWGWQVQGGGRGDSRHCKHGAVIMGHVGGAAHLVSEVAVCAVDSARRGNVRRTLPGPSVERQEAGHDEKLVKGAHGRASAAPVPS
jgi:hypothetical protein